MEGAGRKTRCPAMAIQCDSCGTRPTTHCDPCATRHDLCATCCNPLAPSGCGHGPEMGPCCQETLFPMPPDWACCPLLPCPTCVHRSQEPEPVECLVLPEQQRITRERLHCSKQNWSHLREKGGLWLERRVVPAPFPSLCLQQVYQSILSCSGDIPELGLR